MAQTIIGLDIGSFSVKVATVTASFRSFAWTGYREYAIPHSERDRPERAATEVLKEVAASIQGSGAIVVGSMAGDRVMTRFVTLPFSDPKRIDSVLGFELVGQIPLGVEDILTGYQVVGQTPEGGTEIFAAAAERQVVEKYLEDLQQKGIDPRVVTLDTTSYLNLYDHLAVVGQEPAGCVAFVDIGHRTTNVCIVERGRLRMARAIGRGGLAVTQALAEAFALPFEEAEVLKHEQAALPVPYAAVSSDVSRAVTTALTPLVIALRQSFQSQLRQTATRVEEIYVTGGGSRLANFAPWLELELGLPVRPIPLASFEFNKVADLGDGAGAAAKGVGLALVQAGGSRHVSTIDFRRGSFAYAGDFQFLKDKLAYLGVMALLLVAVAVVFATVKNNSLQRTLDQQEQALADFTTKTLGKPIKSYPQAIKKFQKPPAADDEAELFPPMTAIAVLEKITAVQEEMNRAAIAAATPGAPINPDPPGVDGRMPAVRDALGRQRQLRGGLPGDRDRPALPVNLQPRIGAGPRGMRGDPVDEPFGDEPTDPLADGDKPPAPPAPMAPKMELSIVNIDLFGEVELQVETQADNVEGMKSFPLKLGEVPCFSQVKRKDMDPVIAKRHEGWKRFKITFKVKCKKESAKDGEAEAVASP